ncbi:DNA methyltransferase [Ochrobactrum vermis]|uniref:site-specific DNA-methyltransferase (adenine-specific) n=1 Tax=Ochrobactrum vermis TaxID=1827297 RepID=A0ABU8PAR8_9HYPH
MDVIERCIELWSNPGDVILTPFLGIGSEVYGAVAAGRKGIGFELKPSYFAQAARNIDALDSKQDSIFDAANDNAVFSAKVAA